jgi:hypothetical protein
VCKVRNKQTVNNNNEIGIRMKTSIFKSKITFCLSLIAVLVSTLTSSSSFSKNSRKRCHKAAAQLITLRHELRKNKKNKKHSSKKNKRHKKNSSSKNRCHCKSPSKKHSSKKNLNGNTTKTAQPAQGSKTVDTKVDEKLKIVEVSNEIAEKVRNRCKPTKPTVPTSTDTPRTSQTIEGTPQEKLLLEFADDANENVSWECLVDNLTTNLKDPKYKALVNDLKSLRDTKDGIQIGQAVSKHKKLLQTPALAKALKKYDLAQLLALMNKRIDLNGKVQCRQA